VCVCILAPPRDAEASPPRRETESQRVLPRPFRTAFPGPSPARPQWTHWGSEAIKQAAINDLERCVLHHSGDVLFRRRW